MRLFLAINFDQSTKEKLLEIQQKLKSRGTGNFSRPENLHLTILFLGEVQDDSTVRKSMEAHFHTPITLSFARVGSFKGNIYWAGIEPNPDLNELHTNIYRDLRQAGYKVDWNESFTPHITLGREVILSGGELSFNPFSMTARRISLMKSERINGILEYTEVYGKSV